MVLVLLSEQHAHRQEMDSPVLLQVNQEIAGVLEEIRLANADLETAKTFDEKAAIKQSIKESKEALTRLRADRTSALALAAASVPAPGKNAPSRPRR